MLPKITLSTALIHSTVKTILKHLTIKCFRKLQLSIALLEFTVKKVLIKKMFINILKFIKKNL